MLLFSLISIALGIILTTQVKSRKKRTLLITCGMFSWGIPAILAGAFIDRGNRMLFEYVGVFVSSGSALLWTCFTLRQWAISSKLRKFFMLIFTGIALLTCLSAIGVEIFSPLGERLHMSIYDLLIAFPLGIALMIMVKNWIKKTTTSPFWHPYLY